MKPELVRRQEAVAKTMARFAGKPFVLGRNDCVQLARFHLRAMGHRKLPKPGSYSTPVAAARALKSTGFATLEALLDSLLRRIAPAEMLPGDIALVEGDDGGECIIVSVGRKFIGWHPDQDALAVIEPFAPYRVAWRA